MQKKNWKKIDPVKDVKNTLHNNNNAKKLLTNK